LLNGASVPGNEIRRSSLKASQTNEIEVHLRAVVAPALTVTQIAVSRAVAIDADAVQANVFAANTRRLSP
jgi:hypothetical protein